MPFSDPIHCACIRPIGNQPTTISLETIYVAIGCCTFLLIKTADSAHSLRLPPNTSILQSHSLTLGIQVDRLHFSFNMFNI